MIRSHLPTVAVRFHAQAPAAPAQPTLQGAYNKPDGTYDKPLRVVRSHHLRRRSLSRQAPAAHAAPAAPTALAAPGARMTHTYPKVLQITHTCITTSHMLCPFGLKTTQNHQNHSTRPFWAFRTSKIAVSWARRRPKQAQHATNIPYTAPDTTYVHCYQSHVAPIWLNNRSNALNKAHFGLSGRAK